MPDDSPRTPMRAMTRRERRRLEAGAVPRILTVCTGNICRSPLAEVVLRARLDDLPVAVHSAGIHALVGHGMTPQAINLATQAEVDVAVAEAHRARYLVEPMIDEADLVLVMTGDHRETLLQMTPRKRRQIVTVREFERLAAAMTDEQIVDAADAAGAVPTDRVTAAVTALTDGRSLPRDDDADDVVDPYRQSDAVYRQSADEMLPALSAVERVIRLALR